MECACVGVADAKTGEAVKLVVKDPLTEEQVRLLQGEHDRLQAA
jgi:hypothetical protein